MNKQTSPRKHTYYSKKENALKKMRRNEILCNRGITKYFILENYKIFADVILSSKKKDFYEYINGENPVKLFFDIEIYEKENDSYFKNYERLLREIFEKVEKNLRIVYKDVYISKIVLESHNDKKKSFHIIYNLKNGQECLVFRDVSQLKDFWKFMNFDKIKQSDNNHTSYVVDPSVYRTGLFRTVYSSKNEEPPRPLTWSEDTIKSDGLCENSGHLKDSIEDSFICNIPEKYCLFDFDFYKMSQSMVMGDKNVEVRRVEEAKNEDDVEIIANIPQELSDDDRVLIKRYVNQMYHHLPNKIRDILIDKEKNCIIVALLERFCHFVEREHRSNNQYIIIDATSSKQRCHDSDEVCVFSKHNEIKMEDYPKEINVIIKKCLKVNKQELDLIDHAIEECKTYINENFDESIDKIQFDKKEMVFRGDVSNKSLVTILGGKCNNCKIEHQISNTGYCMKCIVCKSIFPKSQLIPVDDRYKNLNNFWMNYSQLVNNGTVNINIYQGEEDFTCDVQLDNSILKNKELTKLYNQVLDGHKITKLAEVIYYINKDFVYTKNNWYYFNGSIWKLDEDNLNMKKSILDSTNYFNKITNYYENKKVREHSQQLIKNIKSLITKINKPGFKDDVIKEAKMFYNDPDFMGKLNSKKHLIPFTNGVYDLLMNEFRSTVKEDYINLTVSYAYEQVNENKEVYKFLEEVLPLKGVRDYVLKKMSECLNGDIPNTYFLMFIGDTGANGKSQLLNLMKLTMGEFGEKVEVTLLTRKRNNANEANSEKIKLLNKRFAFLSEPEDGEKINIGLLKELTGSEEIVARGLYQDSLSFVMEAKLFLACNELPEIKGEDTALWRRIRAVDFPSRFVDEPKETCEYKIDRTLPSRMREDITWRQTFMKILISYYYRDDIREPEEVKIRTNEYRQENNDFYNWLDENIEYSGKENDYIELKMICESYLNKQSIHSKVSSKYKKEIEKYIKDKYPMVCNEYKQCFLTDGKRPRGWTHFKIRDI